MDDLTQKLHAIFHGSDKCAYGGSECPQRQQLKREIENGELSVVQVSVEPSEQEMETARTIVKRCGIRDGLFKGPRTLNAVETIAYALADARRNNAKFSAR